MTYNAEKDMYPDVCDWLGDYLVNHNKRSRIQVFDSSRKSLNRLIIDEGLSMCVSPEWKSWDIQVDIVGFVHKKRKSEIVFVECKLKPVTVRDLSQLLGYCRVVRPDSAFLVSPTGFSDSLVTLIKSHSRMDVLEYDNRQGHTSKSIVVARWDENVKTIDYTNLMISR